MGLLDDAIREHLELKRLRGADPDELARQEDEALGDPRNAEVAVGDAPVVPGVRGAARGGAARRARVRRGAGR